VQAPLRIYRDVRTLDHNPSVEQHRMLGKATITLGSAQAGDLDKENLKGVVGVAEALVSDVLKPGGADPVLRGRVARFFYTRPLGERLTLPGYRLRQQYQAAGGPGSSEAIERLINKLKKDEMAVEADDLKGGRRR
jgi:hypothetical protein